MYITNGIIGLMALVLFVAGPLVFSTIVIIQRYTSVIIGNDILLLACIVAVVQLICICYLLWNGFRKQSWLN
ncbi:hypothetical protein H744_1c1224 [Photobacterium gaetbulicola Gung47]|uniref:Uncharacterized protein n=1 Tax=Photobacterium gaetbulicola Gung47 TaxID=658445 RepID=A0A0C5WGL8_9GAMM|nr:hypothetical protein H744_1c1224 [Photobacterium gaetbulicola Gung47]